MGASPTGTNEVQTYWKPETENRIVIKLQLAVQVGQLGLFSRAVKQPETVGNLMSQFVIVSSAVRQGVSSSCAPPVLIVLQQL